MAAGTVPRVRVQVPLVRGGAELLVQQLVTELRRAASRPIACRSRSSGIRRKRSCRTRRRGVCSISARATAARSISIIATKFPTYFARHPRKVCWLVHQHRAAYELCGTSYSDFGDEEIDVGLRDRLMALDEEMLGECRGLYTISRTVSSRLEKLQRPCVDAALPSAAHRARACTRGAWPVRAVGRAAREEQARRSRRPCRRAPASHLRLVVVGEGSHRRAIEEAAEDGRRRSDYLCRRGQRHRTRRALPRRTLPVYAPFDEDYGLATLLKRFWRASR